MSALVEEKILNAVENLLKSQSATLNEIMQTVQIDADTALKALSSLNAIQTGNYWYLSDTTTVQPKTIKPFFSNPKNKAEKYCLEVEKLIIDAGTVGIAINKIQELSGLTSSQIYQAMTDMRKAHIEITKTTFAGVAYFTYQDVEFIPPQQINEKPRTVTSKKSAQAQGSNVLNTLLSKTKTVITKQLHLEKDELEQWLKDTLGFTDLMWMTEANGKIVGVIFQSKVEE